MKKILIPGGAGYIGSHTAVSLINAGHEVVILDDLSNSRADVIDRIEKITGKRAVFMEGDVRDTQTVRGVFKQYDISAVIHFAAKKAVGESVTMPLEYYDVNVHGMLNVLFAMREFGVKQFVFSSSATVYGNPATVPITEDMPLSATSPYGQTKIMGEQIVNDLLKAEPDWKIAILRYFNPIGAHESGLIGELAQGVPNNLMPYLTQVAVGQRPYLSVFGNDYPTPDGSGVRDYIHVMDLAEGHVAALKYLGDQNASLTVNLGTGQGYSVLDLIKTFEAATGVAVPYRVVDRRPGDIAECWANPGAALRLMGWRADRDLLAMCRDSWRWQQWATQ